MRRRRAATLQSARPAPSSAQVEGSGTAATLLTFVKFTFQSPPFWSGKLGLALGYIHAASAIGLLPSNAKPACSSGPLA